MIKFRIRPLNKLPAAWLRGLALVAIVTVFALAAISCRTVNRPAVMLPNVPGANYICSKEC